MEILLSGLVMGIVYAATPGPVNAETLRRGLKGGFLDSLALQSGASAGRIFYALVALLGAGLLLQGTEWQLATGLFGVIVLLYLGLTTIRDRHMLVTQRNAAAGGGSSYRRAFGMGAILSLANPVAAVFWLSIGTRAIHKTGIAGLPFLLGFLAGCLLTSLMLVLFASRWQPHLSREVAQGIGWSCGLILIVFGLRLAYSLGQHLFY